MSSNVTVIVVNRPLSPAALLSFSLAQVYVYVFLVALSLIIHKFKRLFRKHPSEPFKWYWDSRTRIRRNLITYYLQILITTLVLIVFLVYGIPLLFVSPLAPIGPYQHDIELVLYFAQWIGILYLFELSYKLVMNWQLALHHACTIILLCLVGTNFAITLCWVNVQGVICLGMTALTEQVTFVALITYRMEKWKVSGYLFIVSAIWNLIIKTFFVALCCYIWWEGSVNIFTLPGYEDAIMWVYLYWFLVLPLYFSQVYASLILFRIYRVCMKKAHYESTGELYPSLGGKKRSVREALIKQEAEFVTGDSTMTIVRETDVGNSVAMTSFVLDKEIDPLSVDALHQHSNNSSASTSPAVSPRQLSPRQNTSSPKLSAKGRTPRPSADGDASGTAPPPVVEGESVGEDGSTIVPVPLPKPVSREPSPTNGSFRRVLVESNFNSMYE